MADFLLKNYIFIFIPVINPDGVESGNFRFNSLNQNLNRYYKDASKKYQPEIYLIKELIKNINKIIKIFLFCDYHSHGSLRNFFVYGNNMNFYENLESKTFCKILSLYDTNFNFQDCIFSKNQMLVKDKHDKYSKQGCSRVYIYTNYKIFLSFTLEIGYYIKNNFENKISIKDYENIGINFIKSIFHLNKKNYDLKFKNYNHINQIRNEILSIKNYKMNIKLENSIYKLYERFYEKFKTDAINQVKKDIINKKTLSKYYKNNKQKIKIIPNDNFPILTIKESNPKNNIFNIQNKKIKSNFYSNKSNNKLKPKNINLQLNSSSCNRLIFNGSCYSMNNIQIFEKNLYKNFKKYNKIKKEVKYKYLINNQITEKVDINKIYKKRYKSNEIYNKDNYFKIYNNYFLPVLKKLS